MDSVAVLTYVCVMTGTGGCRSPVVQPAGAGLCHSHGQCDCTHLCLCVMTGTGGCRSPVVQLAGAGLCHRWSWTGVAVLTYGSLPGGNCATAGPEGSTGNS